MYIKKIGIEKKLPIASVANEIIIVIPKKNKTFFINGLNIIYILK